MAGQAHGEDRVLSLIKNVIHFIRLEPAGILPKLSAVSAFGSKSKLRDKNGRKIVGLEDDSDVEEDITTTKKGKRAKKE